LELFAETFDVCAVDFTEGFFNVVEDFDLEFDERVLAQEPGTRSKSAQSAPTILTTICLLNLKTTP